MPHITRRRLLEGLAAALAVGGVPWGYWKWKYPYGWSHCCDVGLWFCLCEYARDHFGAFPAGGASPEASLSMLYPKYSATADLLRGKSVALEVVQAKLDRGEPLDPESCGWHYVEGLNETDDSRLALFWDKEGLDHNGGRLREGGHIVVFVDCAREYIPGSKWAGFLEEQKQRLGNRGQKA